MAATDSPVKAMYDLDFESKETETNNNAHINKASRRTSLSTETESVQVVIYRRTSQLTASSGVYKVDPNNITPHHQRIETGMNLWDNSTTTSVVNYQLHENDSKETVYSGYDESISNLGFEDELEELNQQQIATEKEELNTDTPIPKKGKQEIEIFKYNETKSRNSMDIDVSTVIFHESDDDEEEKSAENKDKVIIMKQYTETLRNTTKPLNETDIVIDDFEDFEEMKVKPTRSSKTEHLSKDSKSTMLEMTGTPYAIERDTMSSLMPYQKVIQNSGDLDEQFFIEFNKEKQRNSDTIEKHKHNELNTINIMKKKKKKKKKALTEQNLMAHDYNQSVDEMKLSINDDDDTDRGSRYIDLTDDEHHSSMDNNIIIKKANTKKGKMKLSTKVKYVTAFGAICAVTVFIGFVLYSSRQNNSNSFKTKRASDILIIPQRRRSPPRI